MLNIIKAADRLKKQTKTNIVLLGQSGVGKTTQARTLDPDTTAFIDLEAGTLAIEGSEEEPGWAGDVIKVRDIAQRMGAHPWDITRAITCLITGPDPLATDNPDDPSYWYSQLMFSRYKEVFPDFVGLEKYTTLFLDSITVASRWAFSWSQKQPKAFSEKTGKPDTRGAYGLLGQEVVIWLTNMQHCEKSVIMAGILEQTKDALERMSWEPQIEGGKTGRELPGIFDEIITLADLKTPEGTSYRAFICHQQNPWGFPAKDRSGTLDLQEPPDLGALMRKIRAGKRLDTTLVTALPKPAEKKA